MLVTQCLSSLCTKGMAPRALPDVPLYADLQACVHGAMLNFLASYSMSTLNKCWFRQALMAKSCISFSNILCVLPSCVTLF